MRTSARISGLVLIAGLAGACAGDSDQEETDQTGDQALGELESDLELAGGPEGMFGPPEAGPLAFLGCDRDPEIEWGEVCGHATPVAVHLEWSDCQDPMGTSSGTADIGTEADTAGCDALERQVTFTVSRSLPRGDGAATATGQLALALTRDAAGPSAVVNGAVDVALPWGPLAVAISDVVRVPAECRYPIAGQVERVMPDGTSHLLVFGSECGQATADGQPIDLATWRPPQPGGGGF